MKVYKIQTRTGTFRRAGYRFERKVTGISEDDLTEEQIFALENEPRLIVNVSEVEDEAAKKAAAAKKTAEEAAKQKAAEDEAKKDKPATTPAKKKQDQKK